MKTDTASKDIKPDAQYEVTLSQKVQIGPLKFLPRHHHVVRGDVLLTILDKVESYQVVN